LKTKLTEDFYYKAPHAQIVGFGERAEGGEHRLGAKRYSCREEWDARWRLIAEHG